jgi:hypothetical protein
MSIRSHRAAAALACTVLAFAGRGLAAEGALGSQASAGGLTVMQIATTDPKKLLDNWGKEGEDVRVESASVMRRGQPIATFILFSGCRQDAAGNCNLTVDFEVTGPTGAVYNRAKDVKVWVDRPAPPPKGIGLSEDGLGMRIEPQDPVGLYTVRATVFDHVSGVRLQTSQALQAVN